MLDRIEHVRKYLEKEVFYGNRFGMKSFNIFPFSQNRLIAKRDEQELRKNGLVYLGGIGIDHVENRLRSNDLSCGGTKLHIAQDKPYINMGNSLFDKVVGADLYIFKNLQEAKTTFFKNAPEGFSSNIIKPDKVNGSKPHLAFRAIYLIENSERFLRHAGSGYYYSRPAIFNFPDRGNIFIQDTFVNFKLETQ
ncbi:hypothetical protein J4474_03800 [Candidatus Pacearchaeota archaeon]|nr:hypothetical protein [Candidatus Pacearchaeota archaeon]